jgi:hypothetical protein
MKPRIIFKFLYNFPMMITAPILLHVLRHINFELTDLKEMTIHKPLSPFFTKVTQINKHPSHLFTAAALPLHGSEECY